MAEDEPFDGDRPHDETWWTRELHRNEKLMDKLMASLGDNPDWERLERTATEDALPDDAVEEAALAEYLSSLSDGTNSDSAPHDAAPEDSDDDPDEDPEVNGNYPVIAKLAREFAGKMFDLENPPPNADLLYLSAGKVGANLAGGHGLGYDEEFLCGNIVKCRWALSDCEFCREIVEQLFERTGEAQYAELAADSRHIAELLRDRIARLRHRVWW